MAWQTLQTVLISFRPNYVLSSREVKEVLKLTCEIGRGMSGGSNATAMAQIKTGRRNNFTAQRPLKQAVTLPSYTGGSVERN